MRRLLPTDGGVLAKLLCFQVIEVKGSMLRHKRDADGKTADMLHKEV